MTRWPGISCSAGSCTWPGTSTQAKRLTGAGNESFERDTLIMAAIGRATSGVDYVDAVERRHEHTRRLSTFFETYDLLLTPTLATPPPKIGEFDLPVALQRASDALIKTRTARLLRHTKIVDDMVEQNLGWVPYTQLANLTGRPAISLPLHWTADASTARCPVRRTPGWRGAADPAGGTARAGASVGRSGGAGVTTGLRR